MELTGRPMAGDHRTTARVGAAGSFSESILGAGAAVLAILGLFEIYPFYMMTIATIAVGAALFLMGGAVAGRYRELSSAEHGGETTGVGSGMSVEVLAGLAGISLGILALIGVYPAILIPAAVLSFGAALIIGTDVNEGLSASVGRSSEPNMAREGVRSTSGLQKVAGIGALVLGILALVGVQTYTVSMIALLAIGASIFLGGAALGGSLARASK